LTILISAAKAPAVVARSIAKAIKAERRQTECIANSSLRGRPSDAPALSTFYACRGEFEHAVGTQARGALLTWINVWVSRAAGY
jgi:hypothetical protein